MKKILILVSTLVLVLILSGCSNEIKEFNREYECLVYDATEEEVFYHIRSYKIVNKFWTSNRDGVYLEGFDDTEYYFSGHSWKLICVKHQMIE